MSEILWQEDFRRYLKNYISEQDMGTTKEKDLSKNWYFSMKDEIYLCPEANELFFEYNKEGERIVDFSNKHNKAKTVFNKLVRERIIDGRIAPIKWNGDSYYWRHKSSNGITLRPGLLNDRIDKVHGITLGDESVHGLIVGRTGSGKSVLLNNLLITLMDEYAPWELNLYLVDMKKVELGAYMSKGNEAAHVKACAATSQVKYVVSMFRSVERIMQYRQNLFTAIGYKKIADFRDDNLGLVLPRILIVVDEFQQLFLNATAKEAEELKMLINSIVRLGRATGVHLLFASQEMTGTSLGALLGNFKLRMALSCDADVSSTILGNSEASKLEKNHVLVNCKGGNIEHNLKYKVPFSEGSKENTVDIENQYLQGHIAFVRNMAIQTGFMENKVQKYYQEDLQYDIHMLEQSILPKCASVREKCIQNREKYLEAFILGDKVLYDTSKVDLESVCFEKGQCKNIAAITTNGEDMAYLQKLFVDNIASSPLCKKGMTIDFDYYSFDPSVQSMYHIEKDEYLGAASIIPNIKGDEDIPEMILELILRQVLFSNLSRRVTIKNVVTYFEKTSFEYIRLVDQCQATSAEKALSMYETNGLKELKKRLTARLNEAIEDEEFDLTNFILKCESDESLIEIKVDSEISGNRAKLTRIREEEHQITTYEERELRRKQLLQRKKDCHVLLKLLKHFNCCINGEKIEEQFPFKIVFLSNINRSFTFMNSSCNDIDILHRILVPNATVNNMLFFYFLSSAVQDLQLKRAVDYFFVSSKQEKDYDFCGMTCTNKNAGDITIDAYIRSKNIECSFKKFRWICEVPKVESLDFDSIENLYEEDKDIEIEASVDDEVEIEVADSDFEIGSKVSFVGSTSKLDFF